MNLRQIIEWQQWPDGRRCYLNTPAGRVRIHHGLVGLLLAVTGCALMFHDANDRYWCHD